MLFFALFAPMLASCTFYVRGIGRTQETFNGYSTRIWKSPGGDLALDTIARYHKNTGLLFGDKDWTRRRFVLVDADFVVNALEDASEPRGVLFDSDLTSKTMTTWNDEYIVEKADNGEALLFLRKVPGPSVEIIPPVFHADNADESMLPSRFQGGGGRYQGDEDAARVPYAADGRVWSVRVGFSEMIEEVPYGMIRIPMIRARWERTWWGKCAQVLLLPAFAADAVVVVYVVVPVVVVTAVVGVVIIVAAEVAYGGYQLARLPFRLWKKIREPSEPEAPEPAECAGG